VPGLDGSGKMGKSEGEGNAVFLVDEPEVIRKKMMKAVTDSGPTQPNQEKPEVIQNLFTLLQLVAAQDTVQHFEDAWNNCTIRYGDLKKQLAEDMIRFTAPIRERVKEFYNDTDRLHRILSLGAEKARASGGKTVNEVREIIGFRKF
ncbi:MAG TPA: tryptophan--tRNA ligase, partial [Chitinophagales bacterium]|nr:tryptophan--tRNA ligase [Chitinophagales bacterium]